MTEIRVIQSNQREVAAGDATTGVVREQAVAGEGVWVGLVRAAPDRPSGWHHHGDYDTYFYVQSGQMRMEFGPNGSQIVEAGPGDFVHVPRHLIHREVNPSPDEASVILMRVGTGPPVVNVPGPQPA
jgi:uncharacterized RmlC-like cupin family protein